MRLDLRAAVGAVNDAAKRACDIALATVALVVLSPAMLLVALAVRIETPGKILYRQVRLGQHGRRFWLFKFRKFPDTLKTQGPAVTQHEDARLTRVGRFLQRTKLDELPQFWNVLKGEMSMVGPRPESDRFADCFGGDYAEVLRYRPGLFGPSQVLFRNESAFFPKGRDPEEFYREVLFPAKARVDMAYFAKSNVMSDLRWLLYGGAATFLPGLCGRQCDSVLVTAELWIQRWRRATGARELRRKPCEIA